MGFDEPKRKGDLPLAEIFALEDEPGRACGRHTCCRYVDPLTLHVVNDCGRPWHIDCWYDTWECRTDGSWQMKMLSEADMTEEAILDESKGAGSPVYVSMDDLKVGDWVCFYTNAMREPTSATRLAQITGFKYSPPSTGSAFR